MNFLKKAFGSVVLTLAVLMALGFSNTNAQTSPKPVFNWYDNVEGVGDEGDFLRIGKTAAGSVNTKEVCEDGTRVDFWWYIHNSSEPEFNGVNFDGPGVARNTRLNLSVPQKQLGNKHDLAATISADRADTVRDGATITCGSKKISLEYVGVTDFSTTAVTSPLGDFKLVGDPINGASLGYPGGVVPGCWEYRARLNFQVIVRVEKEVPKPSTGDCKEITNWAIDQKNRKVSLKVVGTTQNAEIVGYKIEWGDGSVSNKQEDSHSYAKDGTYKIVASVQVKYADGKIEWKPPLAACQREVTFKTDTPPVVVLPPVTPVAKVTPAALPKTGPADVMGLFAATSAGGAFVHRYILSRRNRY